MMPSTPKHSGKPGQAQVAESRVADEQLTAWAKSKTKEVGLRRFAASVGIQPGPLSELLAGRRSMSERSRHALQLASENWTQHS